MIASWETSPIHGSYYIKNIEFRVGDMLDLHLPATEFDPVICEGSGVDQAAYLTFLLPPRT
jgi:hypothetical protein